MFPYMHGNIWSQARDTENKHKTWHQEQNLPVVVLRKANLFNRVVSALEDKPGDRDKGSNPDLPQGNQLHQYPIWRCLRKSNPRCRRDSPVSWPLDEGIIFVMEERTGLEPASSAWRADMLPFTPTLHVVIPAGVEPTFSYWKSDVLTTRRRDRICVFWGWRYRLRTWPVLSASAGVGTGVHTGD